MSYCQDSFDDNELTMMADEIMRDLATKENLDPTASNPFHYLFTSDNSDCVDKLPSLSTVSSVNTDDYMVYVNYPSMSPNIVSSSKLLQNDSFNQSFPSIPLETNNQANNKQAVNGWCTRKVNKNNLPYIPPPSIFIDESSSNLSINSSSNDISSCISPRNHTKKQTECHAKIPDFGDDESNNDICNKYKYKSKKKKKKKHKNKKHPDQNKTYDAYTLKRIISPICIDFDRHKTDKKQLKFFDEKSITPAPKNEKKNQNINRKNRAHSVDINMDEYVIEFEHGFMFVNNRNDNV